MLRLNNDELFSLAIHLDLPHLLKLCSSSKHIDNKLCMKDDIWDYKLQKEFPDYRNLNVENKSKKEIYKLAYSLSQLKRELNLKENI